MSPEDFLADSPLGQQVYDRVHTLLADLGTVEVKVTKSQIAFKRRRGFAYLWMPGRYLDHPDAEIVLSIALGREERSPRFKEVAHPATHVWQHHLELADAAEVDAEVAGWLEEAYEAAG